MGFGFVVVNFSLFIKQLSYVLGEKIVIHSKGYSSVTGKGLVALDAVMSLLALLRYQHIQKQLAHNTYFPSPLLSILLTVSILSISILLILYLLPNM